jgi:cytochrome c-type biogenesis protein CcmH/NrfG
VDTRAVADEKQPADAGVKAKRVVTRVEPAVLEKNDAPLERCEPSQPRVVVRDLRKLASTSEGQPDPFRRHHPYGRGWSLPRGALLYAPYGFYYRHDSYSPARRLLELYRVRRHIAERERSRRFNRKDMAQRKQRLLDKHEQALAAGLERLKEGQPERAIVALTLAAKLNQGDPACRIHLAQARLAQGHYAEAALALRRALELQPKLVYVDLHLRDYYAATDALDQYTDALAGWIDENPARPEVHFLLGFLEFQRGRFAAAHSAFALAAQGLPKDDLTRDCLEITKPPTR